jgi:hypothetical protein
MCRGSRFLLWNGDGIDEAVGMNFANNMRSLKGSGVLKIGNDEQFFAHDHFSTQASKPQVGSIKRNPVYPGRCRVCCTYPGLVSAQTSNRQ